MSAAIESRPAACRHGVRRPAGTPDPRVTHCSCCGQATPMRLHLTMAHRPACAACCENDRCPLHGSIR